MSGTTVNLIATSFSLMVFTSIAIWYVYPWVKTQEQLSAFVPLIGIHLFRNVGMMALAPGMAASEVSISIYEQMAYGDLISAALALIAIFIIRNQKSMIVALGAIWVFNIFGFLDVLHAMNLAMGNGLADLPMGATWLVGVFYVPMLIVSHIMIFYMLRKRNKRNPLQVQSGV